MMIIDLNHSRRISEVAKAIQSFIYKYVRIKSEFDLIFRSLNKYLDGTINLRNNIMG